jgi:hypothetical protein
VVADHNIGCPSLAVDQDPDLTADFKRELANGLGEFRRDDIIGLGSSTIKIGQAADLACLESADISIDFDR